MKADCETDLPPVPLAANLRRLWMLRDGTTFLNHGSFGAVPRVVFDAQTAWRERIESEPVELIGRRNFELVSRAKRPVADLLGMSESNFGLVTNATEGVNVVLGSLSLNPGDELLTVDHVYHAVRQAMKLTARRAGARYVEVPLALPVNSPSEIVDAVLSGLTPRTKLLVIDHVTSPTALVFPIARIIEKCAEKGVDVLVDGAHAPGMIPLHVEQLGASYYVANLHKWICGPRGSAFLWVSPDRQKGVHPTIVSHFLDEGFAREFGWQGTRDLSAWLTLPRALQFMADLGWERIMEHNHRLAGWAHRLLCRQWDVQPISPLDGSLLGSTASVALPEPLRSLDVEKTDTLQQRLYNEFAIEVPLMRFNGQVLLRVSAQVYNVPQEYERVAQAMLKIAKSYSA